MKFVIADAPAGKLPFGELKPDPSSLGDVAMSAPHEAAGVKNDSVALIVEAIHQGDHITVRGGGGVVALHLVAEDPVDVEAHALHVSHASKSFKKPCTDLAVCGCAAMLSRIL